MPLDFIMKEMEFLDSHSCWFDHLERKQKTDLIYIENKFSLIIYY